MSTDTVPATKTVREIIVELGEPFAPNEVKWKPQVVQGERALAIAYVDARVIQDRLDEVLGPENWQDEYESLPDGTVVCRLKVRIGGEWLVKVDVGGQSEQPDGGDRVKSAFSDSLKRAAVKWGVGRYLYRLGHQWCGYDPKKRVFTQPPQLPTWALPRTPQQRQRDANPPITAQQMEEVNGRLVHLGKDYDWLAKNMQARFGTAEIRDLKYSEAEKLIAGLDNLIVQNAQKK